MSETKAPWKLAWEREFIGAASLLAEWEPSPEREQAVEQYHAFKAGYLAAAEARTPAVPGVVTREHRMLAIACQEEWEYGQLTPDHKAWLDGLPTVGDYSYEDSWANVIAEAESRGIAQASPPADLTAEVARLKAELAELRGQTNEYGPAPASSLAEVAGLLEDLACVRCALNILAHETEQKRYRDLRIMESQSLDRLEQYLKARL